MSMGHTYKFFGFSISYTILTLPLSVLYLPIVLLIPCTFSPFSLFPLPDDNPPNDLRFNDSAPVTVVCLGFFFFFRFGGWQLWVCGHFNVHSLHKQQHSRCLLHGVLPSWEASLHSVTPAAIAWLARQSVGVSAQRQRVVCGKGMEGEGVGASLHEVCHWCGHPQHIQRATLSHSQETNGKRKSCIFSKSQ